MKMIRRLISLAARLCCSLTPSSRDTHAGSAHQGNFWQQTAESGMQVPEWDFEKTMKIESLTLNIIVLFAVLIDCEIRSASAADFCIELTTTEINHGQERRGDANACAGDDSSDIKMQLEIWPEAMRTMPLHRNV
jgi:hypothetical protein